MKTNVTWAEWLRDAIRRSGKSAYQVAQAAGRSHATISQQLSGQPASQKMAVALATATFPAPLGEIDDAYTLARERHIDSALIAAGFQPRSGEIKREAIIDLREFEGFNELRPEDIEDIRDDIALAIQRVRIKQRRLENLGGSEAGRD